MDKTKGEQKAGWLRQVLSIPWSLIRKGGGYIYRKTSAHNAKFKLFTSIFPGLGAVILIFLKDPILNSTTLAWHYWFGGLPTGTSRAQYPVAWLVLFYYVVVLAWIFLYAVFVSNEAASNRGGVTANRAHLEAIKNEISSAIHNAPNPKIFGVYLLSLDEIYVTLRWLQSLGGSEDQLLAAYERALQDILEKIAKLTGVFANQTDPVIGANIMRYIPNADGTKELIQHLKEDRKRWHHFIGVDTRYVRGVLLGIPELIYTGKDEREVPLIALPLIKMENGQEILLPGACWAAKNRESVVDTTDPGKPSDFDSLDTARREETKRYFAGPGKNIKSFASFAIAPPVQRVDGLGELDCLAVLNIDCSSEYIIGSDKSYYSTYFVLVKPLLCLLSPFLERYFALWDAREVKRNNV